MKRYARRKRWILPATAIVLLLSACANFKQPMADAAAVPYQAPPGARSAAFEGMVNRKQVEHIKRAEFPQLNAVERALIREINRDVNEDIIYMSDGDNYGWMDFAVTEPRYRHPAAWGMPSAVYGDCEDYALTKKHRLVERGVDPSRLFVVRAMVPTSDGTVNHVVLAVPEGSDWWILNNWDNLIETASYLKKWWGWDFYWPRFEEYQQLVRARNGWQHNAAARPRG